LGRGALPGKSREKTRVTKSNCIKKSGTALSEFTVRILTTQAVEGSLSKEGQEKDDSEKIFLIK